MWSPRSFRSDNPRIWLNPRDQVLLQENGSKQIMLVSLDFPRNFSKENQKLIATIISLGEKNWEIIPIGHDLLINLYGAKVILKVVAVSNEKFLIQFSEPTGEYGLSIKMRST
ncbi:MAG: hypothetical protein WC835_01135 [Candidatus Paceibacterota bacterium]|jgi:hypothetical protein